MGLEWNRKRPQGDLMQRRRRSVAIPTIPEPLFLAPRQCEAFCLGFIVSSADSSGKQQQDEGEEQEQQLQIWISLVPEQSSTGHGSCILCSAVFWLVTKLWDFSGCYLGRIPRNNLLFSYLLMITCSSQTRLYLILMQTVGEECGRVLVRIKSIEILL